MPRRLLWRGWIQSEIPRKSSEHGSGNAARKRALTNHRQRTSCGRPSTAPFRQGRSATTSAARTHRTAWRVWELLEIYGVKYDQQPAAPRPEVTLASAVELLHEIRDDVKSLRMRRKISRLEEGRGKQAL